MTSKEMKERLSKRPNPHNLYAFNEEQVKELIKDLEILEILNKHYASKQQYVVGTQPIINVFSFHIPNEEAQKIKEWLEK